MASFSAGKHSKLRLREADWRHCVIELHRMGQFQQHYVAGEHPSWSIEFLVHDDFTDRHSNSELVRLRYAMLTNDHNGFIDASRLKSVQQQSNEAWFCAILNRLILFAAS